MNEQLVLGLSLKEALEKEDFFISSSNLDAVTQLGNTDKWPSGVLLLVGPKGCLLYTSPSPRDGLLSRMPSSA